LKTEFENFVLPIANRRLDYLLRHTRPDLAEECRADVLGDLWIRYTSAKRRHRTISTQLVVNSRVASFYARHNRSQRIPSMSTTTLDQHATIDDGPSRIDLADQLQSLSSRTQFIVLRLTANYSVLQIAKELGINESTAIEWIKAARVQVASVLSHD